MCMHQDAGAAYASLGTLRQISRRIMPAGACGDLPCHVDRPPAVEAEEGRLAEVEGRPVEREG